MAPTIPDLVPRCDLDQSATKGCPSQPAVGGTLTQRHEQRGSVLRSGQGYVGTFCHFDTRSRSLADHDSGALRGGRFRGSARSQRGGFKFGQRMPRGQSDHIGHRDPGCMLRASRVDAPVCINEVSACRGAVLRCMRRCRDARPVGAPGCQNSQDEETENPSHATMVR
jgi:hypothetical protein